MKNFTEFADFEGAENVSAFVGQNQEYYFKKWRGMFARAGSADTMQWTISWNWAGAIGTLPWLLYRKMYVPALWFAILLLLSTTFQLLFGFSLNFLLIAFALVVGVYGNGWYFERTLNLVTAVEQRFDNPQDALSTLQQRGGVNRLALTLAIFAIAVRAAALAAFMSP